MDEANNRMEFEGKGLFIIRNGQKIATSGIGAKGNEGVANNVGRSDTSSMLTPSRTS